jgi:hypothetical protein
VQTWKRIGQEEWDDLLDCGLNTMDATTGDPVAIVGVLDCAADQLLGFSFFELLSGLKIADRLGLGWYDDVMGAMTDAMRGIDDLGSLHSLLKSATDTGLDASRIATQRFPGIFDNVKDAFDIADSQLQSKFKHASDFGVDGNWNSTNRERFRNALNQHIQNSETVVGTYRGNPVYHHYDQSSGLNVIQRPNGEFLSGWRLNPDQAANVENRGSL